MPIATYLGRWVGNDIPLYPIFTFIGSNFPSQVVFIFLTAATFLNNNNDDDDDDDDNDNDDGSVGQPLIAFPRALTNTKLANLNY